MTGKTIEITNAAKPTEVIGEAASATSEDALAAVEAAKQAFPAWANVSAAERVTMLKAASKTVMENSDLKLRFCLRRTGGV